MLSGFSLRPDDGAYFPARVLRIELVEDVYERCHVVFSLAGAVHVIVEGNEPYVRVGEYHIGVHSHLKVIAAQAAHVLDDDRTDRAFVHQFHQPLPARPGERSAGIPVVHELGDVPKTVLLGVPAEHGFLVPDAVGIPLQFIVPRQAAVQCRDPVIFCHIRLSDHRSSSPTIFERAA